MTSEYWQKIKAITIAQREERQTARDTTPEERERQHDAAVALVTAIFEEIRTNSPKIAEQPLSEIDTSHGYTGSMVELNWGIKLKLSSADRAAMRGTDISEMLGWDYQSVVVEIIDGQIRLPHYREPFSPGDPHPHTSWNHMRNTRLISRETFPLGKFLADPTIIFPTVGLILERPLSSYHLYTKAEDPGMFKPGLRE